MACPMATRWRWPRDRSPLSRCSLSARSSRSAVRATASGMSSSGRPCAAAAYSRQRATESHAEFDFRGDLHAQAALLKALVHEGYAVSSLAAHKENLQQSYLRSVAAHLENRQ